jgi:hypothetical protein
MTYQVEIREVSVGWTIQYKATVFTTKWMKKFGGYWGMDKESLVNELIENWFIPNTQS